MRDKLHKNGILTESKDVPAHIVRRMFVSSRIASRHIPSVFPNLVWIEFSKIL